MKIKNLIKHLLFITVFTISNLIITAEFNPENYTFSKKCDIQKWINPSLDTPEILQEMQSIIATEMIQNVAGLNSANTVYNIQNNDNDQRFYGKTFGIIASIQMAFLQTIKQYPCPIVVEIGAATGAFSYKIACALNGNGQLIVNDLSAYEIEKAKALFKTRKNIIPLQDNTVSFDSGDAKHFLERLPNLVNKVDFIYVQNVEHFMNPIEHQAFAETVFKMLAPNGQICCVSHTIPAGHGEKGNPFFDTYITLKKKSALYPMFLKTNTINYQLIRYTNTQVFLTEKQMPVVTIPEANEICSSTGSCDEIEEKVYNGSLEECYKIKEQSLLNYFTPTIYEQAYKKAAERLAMKVVKESGGFINSSGSFFLSLIILKI